jgi:hypothetical protein
VGKSERKYDRSLMRQDIEKKRRKSVEGKEREENGDRKENEKFVK